jgi:hypothetical protein
LGIFTIGTFNAGIPIDQDFTVVATDGDGDSVTGVIQTTIVADVAGNQVGTSGADNIVGGAGDNALAGNAGNDTISGGDGNDYVYGGGGNDTLSGGIGNDVLEGGTGADNLTGNAGNDVFVLSTAAITAGQVDTITDYGTTDIVDIREILNVAGTVDPIADGYLRVTTTGLVQVDLTGGANSWQTVANINIGVSPVQVRYIDGGVVTTINVTPTAPAMEAPSIKSSFSTLIGSTDQAANNNSVLLGAIAGAGLMSASAAAAAPAFDMAGFHNDSGFSQSSLLSSTSLRSIEPMGISAPLDGTAFGLDSGLSSLNNGSGFQQQAVASEGLAGHAAAEAPAVSALSQGNDVPAAAQAADAASFAAGDVAMPSLEALAASVAQQGEGAQAAGNVAQVLADALAGGGGPDIDSLLAGLSGGGDAGETLASHDMAAVSAWDMGASGGFTGFHQSFTMEALVLHQDVVVHQA